MAWYYFAFNLGNILNYKNTKDSWKGLKFIFTYGGNYYIIEVLERSQSFSRSPNCFTVQMAVTQLGIKWKT